MAFLPHVRVHNLLAKKYMPSSNLLFCGYEVRPHQFDFMFLGPADRLLKTTSMYDPPSVQQKLSGFLCALQPPVPVRRLRK